MEFKLIVSFLEVCGRIDHPINKAELMSLYKKVKIKKKCAKFAIPLMEYLDFQINRA